MLLSLWQSPVSHIITFHLHSKLLFAVLAKFTVEETSARKAKSSKTEKLIQFTFLFPVAKILPLEKKGLLLLGLSRQSYKT